MSTTAAQVNTTSQQTQAPSGNMPIHCNFPGASVLFPDCLAYSAGQQIGTGISGGISAAGQAVGQGLAQSIAQSILDLVNAPFKALGLNGLNDALWRLLLIFVGLMVLAFGLLVLAGSAVKDEANSPGGQQAAQAAELAA